MPRFIIIALYCDERVLPATDEDEAEEGDCEEEAEEAGRGKFIIAARLAGSSIVFEYLAVDEFAEVFVSAVLF